MALSTPVGSGNKLIAYTISGSGIGTTAFTFNANTAENYNGDYLTSDLVIELTSLIDNEAFQTFKVSYLRNVELTEINVTFVDASQEKSKSVPSTAQKLLVVHSGGQISGKKKLTAFQGIFTKSEGAKSPNTPNEITCTFTAIPSDKVYTLSTATLIADFGVTSCPAVTFNTDAYGTVVFATV